MSAATFFSGSLPPNALQMFEILKVQAIAHSTFFRHQEMYLQPAVRLVWKKQQESLHHGIKQKGAAVALAGDGRADSHSAKYGTYSLLDLDGQIIIHTQLVTVSYALSRYYLMFILYIVNGSDKQIPHGKEELDRALKFLKDSGVSVGVLVTDRHTQIKGGLSCQNEN